MAVRPGFKWVLAAMSSMLVLLILVMPGKAAQVSLNCQGTLKGDPKAGSFVCTGGAAVDDGQVKLSGDRVTYQSDSSTIKVDGNVRFEQGGMVIEGRDLTYNGDTKEGIMFDVDTSHQPAGAESPVFISSQQVKVCSKVSVLENARLTTCDPDNPGYYLASQSIEVYPGDKVVVNHVRFIESGITLFYWPKLVFSLKGDEGQSPARQLNLPRIGRSATEGWFVKSTYSYHGPGDQYGELLLDYMTLLGWGIGVDHTYRDNEVGRGNFRVYAQPNKKTDHTDVQASWEEKLKLPAGIDVSAGSSFASLSKSGGEQRRLYGHLTLAQSREKGSTSIAYQGTQLAGVDEGFDTQATFRHVQDYAGGWKLQLNGSTYRRQRTDMTNRELAGYSAAVSRSTPSWSLNLRAENQFNPDLNKENPPSVAWNRVARLPEFQLDLHRISVFGYDTPFALSGGYGKFAEVRSSGGTTSRITAERGQVTAEVKPLNFSLGRLGTIRWSGSATAKSYSTGQRMWVAGADSSYNLPLVKGLNFKASYQYDDVFGDQSPFRFDRQSEQEQVRAELDYRQTKGSANISGGYDLQKSKPMDLVTRVELKPLTALRLQGQAAYSLQTATWRYGIGTLKVDTDPFTLQLGTKYNIPKQLAERIDASVQVDLGGWKIGYAAIYDGLKAKFAKGDLIITRDLGCRAIDFRYNQVQKEVWLEYRIPAFPKANLKLGANEDRLMFDLKNWEELLQGGAN